MKKTKGDLFFTNTFIYIIKHFSIDVEYFTNATESLYCENVHCLGMILTGSFSVILTSLPSLEVRVKKVPFGST